MQNMTTTHRLASRVRGRILQAGDEGYQAAWSCFNLSVSQKPHYILMATSSQDILEAVRFANAENLDIAVQATGHGIVLPADDCLLINTSQMDAVQIDAQEQTARIEAGTRWGKVLEAAQAQGLAPLLGSSPLVGAVGYTLGGGLGWLGRKYGLSLDNVLCFEVVTANAELIHASETENSDLFWALRGGGGSFGIVTAMEIKLFPVTEVYAGNLFYPAAMAKEVFSHYAEWIKDAPDELTSSVLIMNFPPVPAVPDFLRGQSFVIVRGCYCGTMQAGEDLLKFWRDWQAPVMDDFMSMPFANAAQISNDPTDPMPAFSTSISLNEINESVIERVIEFALPKDAPLPIVFAEIRHAGGAIARANHSASAYGHRHAQHIMQMVYLMPNPEVAAFAKQHSDSFKIALRPYAAKGAYMNFLEGEEKAEATASAYAPEELQRLQAVKAQYDAKNRLNRSFAINPAN